MTATVGAELTVSASAPRPIRTDHGELSEPLLSLWSFCLELPIRTHLRRLWELRNVCEWELFVGQVRERTGE